MNKDMYEILIELQKELNTITTGNLSHKLPTVKMSINYLIEIISLNYKE